MLTRQTIKHPWNITYDDIVASLIKSQSRKSRMPGLYGKRAQGKRSVDYLYYSPIKHPGGHQSQTSYTLFAYGLSNRTPAQFNLTGLVSPLTASSANTNNDSGHKTVAENFQALKTFSRVLEIEPIACDVLLWESSKKEIEKPTVNHSQINTLFDAWGIPGYLDRAHRPIAMQTSHQPATWKNHTWVCIFQYPSTQKENGKNYAVNARHCPDIAVGDHDPLHQPIPIVDNEKALIDYKNLFYTSRFFQGNYYRALSVLSSDYVYWVLGDTPDPCISEVINQKAFESYAIEIQQVASQPIKPADKLSQAYSITSDRMHRYSFFDRCIQASTEELNNNEQTDNSLCRYC